MYVNNTKLSKARVITRNHNRLLPFVEVMTKLGYKVTRSGDAVFIEKGYNRWRFFVNSTIYMNGSDQFGAPSAVIHELNGKLYMSEQMMQEWFAVQIQEMVDRIDVNEQ